MISEQELIQEIEDYENKAPTYQVCEKLANLYIIYDHLYGKHDNEQNFTFPNHSYSPAPNANLDTKSTERKNALPAYNYYAETKSAYQYGDIPKEKVLNSLDVLLQELKNFLKILYRNSDMPEERKKINEFISNVNVGNV